jgi:hypothetical protein
MSTAHDIAQLVRALGAKRSGRQWVCRCPAHDDHEPSLIFWQGHSAIRFKCYAGCEPLDIIAALRRRGLWDGKDADAGDGSSSHQRLSSSSRNRDREDERERARKLGLAERIWRQSFDIAGTAGEAHLARRGIMLESVPDFGSLRWHPNCPWGSDDTAPCIVARFTNAITGAPRGIWRRPIDGREPKSMTLGPMAGCVIRLWPDDTITTGLVLGEGVETTLAAALHITHRKTLLQPAWAAGCADGMANFPVLAGIKTLTLLVDNDKAGQDAAAACARRWVDAGREVIRLTPRALGADFNDIVVGKRS